MKILVASDIHGSAYYCRELIKAYNEEKSDLLLLLGDILYHGPRNPLPKDYNPQEVASLLNPMADKIISVQGNCDSEVDSLVLDFPVLNKTATLFVDGKRIFAFHGHAPENDYPKPGGCDLLLSGHTHVPTVKTINGYPAFNPGSTSLPKENSNNGYMIIENSKAFWKTFGGGVFMEETF